MLELDNTWGALQEACQGQKSNFPLVDTSRSGMPNEQQGQDRKRFIAVLRELNQKKSLFNLICRVAWKTAGIKLGLDAQALIERFSIECRHVIRQFHWFWFCFLVLVYLRFEIGC